MYREFEVKDIIGPYDDLTIDEMINDKHVKTTMIEFSKTICGNVGLLNNGVVKAVRDMTTEEKFNVVMFYKYSDKEFIKI